MYYDDEQVEKRYRSYRKWSTFFTVATLVVAAGGVGVLMSFVIQRPWYEGAVIGSMLGGFLVSMQASNEDFMEYWEEATRDDFEEEEQVLEDAWEKERNRPDDEYVGW